MLYIIPKVNDKGLVQPTVVSLEEAQKVYDQHVYPRQPLKTIDTPCAFSDNNWKDFLWIANDPPKELLPKTE